jgi:hypothetical protein
MICVIGFTAAQNVHFGTMGDGLMALTFGREVGKRAQIRPN